MSLKTGETGKIFRVAAGYDMSSRTELSIKFTKPDATTVTKTQTGGEVALGTIDVTDPDLGALLANEYVEYDIEAGFLDQAGTWTGCLTYTNTAPAPDDIYIGDTFTFTVGSTC
jgi:hypothetical protein